MSKKQKRRRLSVDGSGANLPDDRFSALSQLLKDVPSNAPSAEQPRQAAWKVAKTRKGGWDIRVEKRAKGKKVTVLRRIEGDLSGLLKTLKQRLGTGGSHRDGFIELQGDHKEALERFLNAQQAD